MNDQVSDADTCQRYRHMSAIQTQVSDADSGERCRLRWASSYCFSTDISCQMWSPLNNNWLMFIEFQKCWHIKYSISIVPESIFLIWNTRLVLFTTIFWHPIYREFNCGSKRNGEYILWPCPLNIKHTLLLHLTNHLPYSKNYFNVYIFLDLQKKKTWSIFWHKK